MFDPDQQPYKSFRDQLTAAGVSMRCNWQTRRDGKPVSEKLHHDVEHVSFYGAGFSPAIATAVLIDYGNGNGFGLYVDSLPHDMAECVAAIARPHDQGKAPVEPVRVLPANAFVGYEIRPCIKVNDTVTSFRSRAEFAVAETMAGIVGDDYDAFWTIYGRHATGEMTAIGDFATEIAATEVLASIEGNPTV